jgi:hypothetical protein
MPSAAPPEPISAAELAQRVSASFMAAMTVAMLPTPWRMGAERAPQPR